MGVGEKTKEIMLVDELDTFSVTPQSLDSIMFTGHMTGQRLLVWAQVWDSPQLVKSIHRSKMHRIANKKPKKKRPRFKR